MAFAEVIREDRPVVMIKGTCHCLDVIQFNGVTRCCSYHTASKHTIRPYMYIRGKDLLFKFPKFNYQSTTSTKLKDSLKGLLALFCILNLDLKKYHEGMVETRLVNFTTLAKCG